MLADGLELPDNLLEELEYLDNITSCNKVTYCLQILSTGYRKYIFILKIISHVIKNYFSYKNIFIIKL